MRTIILTSLLLLLPVQAVLAQPAWNLSIGDFVGSLSISSDGDYVVASSLYAEAKIGKIYFLDREGNLLWSYLTSFPICTAISSNGEYVVVGIRSQGIFYLSREGEIMWNYESGASYIDVQISSDGSKVVASTSDGYVLYFNKEGKKLWSYRFSNKFVPISMSSDGSFVAVGGSYEVILLSKLGDTLLNPEVDCEVQKIVMSSDGNFLLVVGEDKLFFLSGEGEVLWSSEVEGEVTSIAFSSDGSNVAVANIWNEGYSTKGRVFFYNSFGELLWSYDTGSWAVVSMSADGNYVVCGGEELFVLDRKGNLLWSYSTGKSLINIVSLSKDGRSVVIGTGGRVIFLSLEEVIQRNPPAVEPEKSSFEKLISITSVVLTLLVLGTIFLLLVWKFRKFSY